MNQHLTAALCLVFATATAHAQNLENLWNSSCASCHGQRGQGSDKAKTLLTEELMSQDVDRRFFDTVMNDPAHKAAAGDKPFAPNVAWGLIVYLRELQHSHYRDKLSTPRGADGEYQARDHKYKVETLLRKGLGTPWAIEFLPDGRALITERRGNVRLWKSGGTLSQPVDGFPAVTEDGQGGLMDVALHPKFAENGWIYFAYADPSAEEPRSTMTRIVRMKLSETGDPAFTDVQTIFQAKQEHYLRSGLHFGSRIVFQPATDGKYYVYFAIGERGRADMAQDRSKPNGKVHRVMEDGSIPSDNPFANESGSYPSIWSFGHRNPQGLTFDLEGKLWDTEHAPRGGDELNLVEKGVNFGWPLVSFGMNYNGSPLRTPWPDVEGGKAEAADIHMPAFRWLPSIAACGLTTYVAPSTGGFTKWNGDLFAGGLAGSCVHRVRVKDGKFVEKEEILFGMGRVRDVVSGPDGAIYVVLNDPGRIVRISVVE